jgi:hypothetical protein
VNPIAIENAKPGDADWLLARSATARQIEGYAGATSVDRGDAIDLFVHTAAPAYTLEVFRIGWYAGAGARRVLGPLTQNGVRQPMPAMQPDTGLVDCAWGDPVRITTRDAATGEPWCSGVHLARLTECEGGTQSYILFVVRDDAGDADALVQLPVTTYQAYNYWGGKSLYHWGSDWGFPGERASQVSFNRPYAANAQNPAAAYGMGAGEFLANLQPHPDTYGPCNAGWDVNMVRWLEREGWHVAYSTNLDTHRNGAALRRHRAWLSIGHDEYWSLTMRDQVQAARDAGVHLGFFGANNAYWQVRLEPSAASGTPDRIMVCHKKARRDPLYAIDRRAAQLTDQWRCDALQRPEEQLIGVMYTADPVEGDLVVAAPEHWAFEGTGLAAGDTLPGLLGYEVDRVHDEALAAERGLTILCASPWRKMKQPDATGIAHMATYTAASGADVFATGTIQWAWGLDDFNVPALRASRRLPAAERITANVLRRFGVRRAAKG